MKIKVTLQWLNLEKRGSTVHVVSIRRHYEPRNRLPDPKGLLLASLPSRVMSYMYIVARNAMPM